MTRRTLSVLWSSGGATSLVAACLWLHAIRDVARVEIAAEQIVASTAAPWQIDLASLAASRSWMDRLAGSWVADTSANPTASGATLLIDGSAIGSGHRLHDELRRGNRGWSHWSTPTGGLILFSTGDGTDPRQGTAAIEVVIPASPRPVWPVLAVLGVLVPLGGTIGRWACRSGGSRDQLREFARTYGGPVLACAIAATIGIVAVQPLVDAPHDAWRRWIVAALMAAVGLRARRASVPGFARWPLRTLAVMFAFFAATATINAPRAAMSSSLVATVLEPGPPWNLASTAAIAAVAVAAWFRPSCLAILVAVVAWKRSAAVALTGFPNVSADWLPAAIAANVLVGGVIVAAWCRRDVSGSRNGGVSVPRDASMIFAMVLPVAATLQLGNYVASAWEKLRISPGWTEWIVGNRADSLVRVADALDVWTPARALGLAEPINDAMAASAVLVNVVTLLVEFAPLVAVFRRRWMIAALLAAVALHATIWFATGLFFWKWIVLDLALAAGLWRLGLRQEGAPVASRVARLLGGVALLGVILLQPRLMETVRLGWFDTPALNRVRFEAVLGDGSVVAIPSDFFASGSYRVASGVFPPAGSGFFPTDTWATTDDAAVHRQAAARTLAPQPPGAFEASCEAVDVDSVLRRHHAWALERATADGRPRIGLVGNLWPHHIVADGSRFGRFAEVDLRDIVAYRAIAEAVWLDRDPDGYGFAPRVVLRNVHETRVVADE